MKLVSVMILLAWGIAQAEEPGTNAVLDRIKNIETSLGFMDAKLARGLNELMWWQRLQDVARIDKVRFTGPPNSAGGSAATNKPGGTNEVIISAYTFFPRKVARNIPLIVFAHGEIHGNVTTDEEA